MRHGEAGNDTDDFARQLTAAGRAAARRGGEEIAAFHPAVDYVFCSAAPRAAETAELVTAVLPRKPRVEVRESLYLALPSAIANLLRSLAMDVRCVLVVGHNPGLSQFASLLAGHRVGLSPSDYVSYVVELEDWRDLLTAKD